MATHNPYRLDTDIDVFRKTAIAGASADTTIKSTPGMLRGVVINTAGNATSSVSLYDGAVSGTAFAIISGAAVGVFVPFDAYCSTSIHVKTVDTGGTINVTVLWR